MGKVGKKNAEEHQPRQEAAQEGFFEIPMIDSRNNRSQNAKENMEQHKFFNIPSTDHNP
jgi:hypothetical protein